MKFTVIAQSFDRQSGIPTGAVRAEVIDTFKNTLFAGRTEIVDVKETYEAFWNNVNPQSPNVVFVSQVTRGGQD